MEFILAIGAIVGIGMIVALITVWKAGVHRGGQHGGNRVPSCRHSGCEDMELTVTLMVLGWWFILPGLFVSSCFAWLMKRGSARGGTHRTIQR